MSKLHILPPHSSEVVSPVATSAPEGHGTLKDACCQQFSLQCLRVATIFILLTCVPIKLKHWKK